MRGKHYHYFGLQHYEEGMLFNELDVKMWDKLRCENIKTPFSIERTKEDYETNCKNRIDYYDKAKIICDNIEAERVVSLGVGTGILEWHMKNLKDDMELVCSDYTEGALKLLQNVTNCSEFKVFDMYADDYRWMVQFDYVIMHRLDTEFSFDSWKKYFIRCTMQMLNVSFLSLHCIIQLSRLVQKKSGIRRYKRKVIMIHFVDGYIRVTSGCACGMDIIALINQ